MFKKYFLILTYNFYIKESSNCFFKFVCNFEFYENSPLFFDNKYNKNLLSYANTCRSTFMKSSLKRLFHFNIFYLRNYEARIL